MAPRVPRNKFLLIKGPNITTNTETMKPQSRKHSIKKQDDYELREEYDLSKMIIMPRGRFDPKHRIGKNLVVLEPDIAEAFPGDGKLGGQDAASIL